MIIIKDLLTNLALLTSLLFFYTQVTSSTPLTRESSLTRKLIMGILGGLLSNILMHYSMKFGPTIIDFRHIPIILVTFYGGTIPALLSTFLVILGRFLISINSSAFASILFIVPITIITLYISSKAYKKKIKILAVITLSNVFFTLLVYNLIKDYKVLIILLPTYWFISYIACFVSFYVVEYIRHSQELFHHYKSESLTDGLTGLNNVRKFDEVFQSLLLRLNSKDETLSLLFIDIDFFKKINDTYGHTEGDEVLKELSQLLIHSTRSFDIVSRNGGEEFTIILQDCPLNRAIEISEQIRLNVETHHFSLLSGKKINITVSIGLASYPETTPIANSLIEEADKALYAAKRTGRNKVCVANMQQYSQGQNS